MNNKKKNQNFGIASKFNDLTERRKEKRNYFYCNWTKKRNLGALRSTKFKLKKKIREIRVNRKPDLMISGEKGRKVLDFAEEINQ